MFGEESFNILQNMKVAITGSTGLAGNTKQLLLNYCVFPTVDPRTLTI